MTNTDISNAAGLLLDWWSFNGVSAIAPLNDNIAPQNPPKPKTVTPPPAAINIAQNLSNPQDAVKQAETIAARCTSLEALSAALEEFEGCALKFKADKMVFADGNPDAPIMLIGEAPGKDEDEQGKPFIGEAGKLIDKMLASIGINRKTNLYITNCVNWRPPGNRTPTKEELAISLPFLKKHIELKRPKALILAGRTAASTILDSDDALNKLRKKSHIYKLSDGSEIPVFCTYHPSYLLKQPVEKSSAWKDLLIIKGQIKQIIN